MKESNAEEQLSLFQTYPKSVLPTRKPPEPFFVHPLPNTLRHKTRQRGRSAEFQNELPFGDDVGSLTLQDLTNIFGDPGLLVETMDAIKKGGGEERL